MDMQYYGVLSRFNSTLNFMLSGYRVTGGELIQLKKDIGKIGEVGWEIVNRIFVAVVMGREDVVRVKETGELRKDFISIAEWFTKDPQELLNHLIRMK